MTTTINGKESEWTEDIWSLFQKEVASRCEPNEVVRSANYYTPRPYVDEYNRGSNKEGFVFVIDRKVCFWERTVK